MPDANWWFWYVWEVIVSKNIFCNNGSTLRTTWKIYECSQDSSRNRYSSYFFTNIFTSCLSSHDDCLGLIAIIFAVMKSIIQGSNVLELQVKESMFKVLFCFCSIKISTSIELKWKILLLNSSLAIEQSTLAEWR